VSFASDYVPGLFFSDYVPLLNFSHLDNGGLSGIGRRCCFVS
jgi:hypothetical protein